MKKALMVVVAVLVLVGTAFAQDFGFANMYSQASLTTIQRTASGQYARPFSVHTVEMSTSPTTSVTYSIFGRASALASMPTNSTYLIVSAATCTLNTCQTYIVDKPLWFFYAVLTSATNTNAIVNLGITGVR